MVQTAGYVPLRYSVVQYRKAVDVVAGANQRIGGPGIATLVLPSSGLRKRPTAGNGSIPDARGDRSRCGRTGWLGAWRTGPAHCPESRTPGRRRPSANHGHDQGSASSMRWLLSRPISTSYGGFRYKKEQLSAGAWVSNTLPWTVGMPRAVQAAARSVSSSTAAGCAGRLQDLKKGEHPPLHRDRWQRTGFQRQGGAECCMSPRRVGGNNRA